MKYEQEMMEHKICARNDERNIFGKYELWARNDEMWNMDKKWWNGKYVQEMVKHKICVRKGEVWNMCKKLWNMEYVQEMMKEISLRQKSNTTSELKFTLDFVYINISIQNKYNFLKGVTIMTFKNESAVVGSILSSS